MSDPPNLIEVLNDTEGLAWGLYYHLWKKTHKGECCPNINIPHTVVYQDSTPIAWYFTSSKDNKIYRKKKSNINGQAICDALSHKHPGVDASAWFSGTMTFMSATPKKKRAGSGAHPGEPVYELEPEEDTKEPSCFDYLSRERLQRLVAPGQYTAITESIYDGVLQKYVLPREAYDHVISNFALTDEQQKLTDRMASFDANTFWLSTHQPLPAGSVLVQRLTTACESIVRHLAEVSAGKIAVVRMQLYFKVDTHNRIWLTLCNSLKLDRSAAQIDRAITPVKAPARKRGVPEEEDTHIPVDPTPFMCVVSGKTYPGTERCDVSYKVLIGDWFAQIQDLQEESDRIQALDTIPPAIRRANPNITREYYLRMRAQPAFLLKTAPVCRQAATDLAAAALKDLSRSIARPRSALAESAVKSPIAATATREAEQAAAAAATAAANKPSTSNSSGGLKLVIKKGPVALPPSNPDFLYEPGLQIPAALIPKATVSHATTGTHRHTMRSTVGSHTPHTGVTLVPVVAGPAQAPQPQRQPSPNRVRPPPAGAVMVTLPLASPASTASPSAVHIRVSRQASGAAATPTSSTNTPGKGPGFDVRPVKSTGTLPPLPQHSVSPGEPYAPGLVKRPTSASRQGKAALPGGKATSPAVATASGRAPHVSSEDLKTLKELSAAYASAEAVTQQLLAEAQNILGDTSVGQPTATTKPATATAPGGSKGASPRPAASGSGSIKAGSRPASAKPGSKPASTSGATPAGMLQPKDGGVAAGPENVPVKTEPGSADGAGLTNDEAALLSDALQAAA